MSSLLLDLKHAARVIFAEPLTTAAAIVSLALGIGGTTAMFSVVDAVVLRPLPYPEADRLVRVFETTASSQTTNAAPANFLDWRASARSFTGFAAVLASQMALVDGGEPEQLRVVSTSGNFFSLLGAAAASGRLYEDADDERAGGERRAVLSYGLWERRYAKDPGIVGRAVSLGGKPATVVGVAERDFYYSRPADIWLLGQRGLPDGAPIPGDMSKIRDAHFMTVVARLSPGVPLATAQAEMDTIAGRLAAAYPDDNRDLGVRLVRLQQSIVGDTSRLLWLLLAAVAFLLLIASVNVANLLLVRAAGRARELALRQALGAGRAALVRQLLVESVLLALVGGVAGLAVAAWGLSAIVSVLPEELPRAGGIALNGRALGAALGLSIVTGILFGTWPALRASRPALVASLQGTRTSISREQRTTHDVLVGAELAIAQVLVVGAGLLLASFVRLTATDPGFDAHRVLAADISMSMTRASDPDRKAQFIAQAIDRLAALPGVTSVASALRGPLTQPINRGVLIEGRPEPRSLFDQTIDFYPVSPRYFETLKNPLVKGRALSGTDVDGGQTVVVVNEAFVRAYLPGDDPIGRRIGYGNREKPGYWREIVGVSRDMRQSDLAEAPSPQVFAPFTQDREPWNFVTFLVRVEGDPMALSRAVKEAIFAIDADQPVARFTTLEGGIAASVATERFTLLVASIFTTVALVLAIVGVFGVASHALARRTQEFGIRLTLGASPRQLLALILKRSAVVAGAAIAVGLAGGWLTARTMSGLLYAVGPADPVVFAAGAVVLGATALAATLVPARRALSRDPMRSLRSE